MLSLFFVDRVANYRSYDSDGNALKGKFANWFEEAYCAVAEKPDYKCLIPFEAEEIHNGYFAQDKKGKCKDNSTVI